MKNQVVTTGIVLSRTNYQEADRILTILTSDTGKISVIAKGVRRPRSKMAGGVELFCENELTLLPGRGEMQTLVSARMSKHYGNIVKDVDRTLLGYDFLKRINRVTEAAAGEEYYMLLAGALAGLDNLELDLKLTKLWFEMQLLDISGHGPNLSTDAEGKRLDETKNYIFDFEVMAFREAETRLYNAGHIRLLRLARTLAEPLPLRQLEGVGNRLEGVLKLTNNMVLTSLK